MEVNAASKPVKEEIPHEDNVLLEWVAPSRPFKRQSQEFYRTALAVVFLIVVILFFVREFMLIFVILSILFVVYALFSVPPEHIKNKITSLGVQTDEHFHKWNELVEFWFDEKYGSKMVVIRTYLGFPALLQLLLGNTSPEAVKKLLVEKLPYKEKPERTFLDKAGDWITTKIPLERTTS